MNNQPSNFLRPCSGERFCRFVALALLALMAATAPLWLPIGFAGTDAADYPPIPSLPLPVAALASLGWIGLALVLIGVVAILFRPQRTRLWWFPFSGLLLLFVVDQQHLQPWAIQCCLYAMLLASLSWQQARPWIIAIAISIYCYSATGKLDYQFAQTVGTQFVRTLLSPLMGVEKGVAAKLALLLPSAELGFAILIAIPKTRRLGGALAIVMHITLIGLLGPWSLNHSYGVLMWNTVLAVQSALLFLPQPAGDQASSASESFERGQGQASMPWVGYVARGVVVLALLAPLSERFGYWDHWASWALYAPHSSRALIQIHETSASELPESLRKTLLESQFDDRWLTLDLGQLSLQQRWVPVYPQARYQLQWAAKLAQTFSLADGIRVIVKSTADRRTGQRDERYLLGQEEVVSAADEYFLGR